MNELDLVAAIKHLRPDSQFTFEKCDYSSIIWQKLDGEPPTFAEIEAAHQAVQQAKIQTEAEAEAKRFIALAKLEALGLTADDLKALGL
jgi:hypothetical protein